jgi:hypothetical protein
VMCHLDGLVSPLTQPCGDFFHQKGKHGGGGDRAAVADAGAAGGHTRAAHEESCSTRFTLSLEQNVGKLSGAHLSCLHRGWCLTYTIAN